MAGSGLESNDKKRDVKMEIVESWALKNRDYGWQDRAACVGKTDMFFMDKKGYAQDLYREAKAICETCPVKGRCLKFSLDNEMQFGVWGGKTPGERIKMLGRKRWTMS